MPKPKIYCEKCNDDMPSRAIASSGVFLYINQTDIRWYQRTRECESCGSKVVTGELTEKIINELYSSKSAVDNYAKTINEYISKNVDLENNNSRKDAEIERLNNLADKYKKILDRIPKSILDNYCNDKLYSLWKITSWLRDGMKIPLDVAQDFVRQTAWWLTHVSRPVRAPGHAERVYSSPHGWAIDFGANTFLIETALRRSREIINQAIRDENHDIEAIKNRIVTTLSGAVANHNGDEYAGFYPLTGGDLQFGSQSIDTNDGARFILDDTQATKFITGR